MSGDDPEIAESDLVNLLNDVHFERIELGLRSANIFDILKISRAEIRHSNFLGWLLDPNENHGLKELVLNRFLRDIFSDEKAKELSVLDAETLDYSTVSLKREWQNIDLLIVVDQKVICVENKVDSKEHSNQLTRYKKIIEENFPKHEQVFVYLTPQGDHPTTEKEHYIPYSYERFAENLERILHVYGDTLNGKVSNYINDYLSVLKRNIMQNDKLNDLALKLYKSHKETLDFIFDNRPDVEQEFRELIRQKVIDSGWVLGSKNKGYVRFLTPKLKEIIPAYDYANGWPDREAFLFEIDFFWSNQKWFVLKPTIAPGDENVRAILTESIGKIENALTPWGKKWICHFIEKKKFDLERISELTHEERIEEIDKVWPMVEAMVVKIEGAILADGRLKPQQ